MQKLWLTKAMKIQLKEHANDNDDDEVRLLNLQFIDCNLDEATERDEARDSVQKYAELKKSL